jgi:hypothetical protein
LLDEGADSLFPCTIVWSPKNGDPSQGMSDTVFDTIKCLSLLGNQQAQAFEEQDSNST